MRQLFNWRLVAAVAAIIGLVLAVRVVFAEDDSLEAAIEPEVIERQVDLIEPIYMAAASDGFRVGRDGVTTGYLDLVIDADRTVRISPGTLGEMGCTDVAELNRCAVFADMLGEAVIWFAILPQSPSATVELPPIVDLQDGQAVFDNGWRIPYAPVIERECGEEDIISFDDFLRRFAAGSTSIVDLETRQVVAVRCAGVTAT